MKAITRTEIPDDQKLPVYFYVDEAQTVIANDAKVPTILDECRSQKIALTIAHQRLNRIVSKDVVDALFNCPVRFASVDNDAAAIAHRFGKISAEELQLTAHRFACYIRYEDAKQKMDKAVILDVPFFDKSTFPPPPTNGSVSVDHQAEPSIEPEPVAEAPALNPQPTKNKGW